MKTLNVVKISPSILYHHWGETAYMFKNKTEIFIRSDYRGVINWDKAPVYTWPEIQKESQKRRVCFRVPSVIFDLP